MTRAALLMGVSLAFAGAAFAQAPADAAPPVEVSEAELDAFATIYAGMESVRAEHAAAPLPDDELALRLLAVIEQHGWTLDEFNALARALDEDAALRARVLARVAER